MYLISDMHIYVCYAHTHTIYHIQLLNVKYDSVIWGFSTLRDGRQREDPLKDYITTTPK